MQPNLYTHQLQLNAGQAHHCLWNVYSTEKNVRFLAHPDPCTHHCLASIKL